MTCCCSILVKSEVFIVTSHSSGASGIWSWHVDGFTIQSFKVCLLSGPGVSVTISALSAAAKTPQELPVSFLSLSYSCICNYNQHQNRRYFTATAKRDTQKEWQRRMQPLRNISSPYSGKKNGCFGRMLQLGFDPFYGGRRVSILQVWGYWFTSIYKA